MASAQLSRTPSYNGSSIPPSRALSRTRGILIETMQLVEPRKEVPVPNHLLESKIYAKVAQNSVVQARPSVIHFGGFELNKTHEMVLNLANVSGDVQRMHIIPPQSKYFYIKYKKNDRLVPGLALECVVEFTPDEWRYYYDCIRIHTKGEENLIIPIHAYPVMDTSEFPEQLSFPPTPVGESVVKTIPLKLTAPIDFEFQLTMLQPHTAFTVDPLAGVIPANDEIEISVTFAPSEFSTATAKMQLTLSQFNSKPLICSFYGYSEPGLEKSLSMKVQDIPSSADPSLDPYYISPLDRARKNRLKNHKSKINLLQMEPQSKEVEVAGVKFPTNLDTPYAVAQVLNQEPGRLRIKDLRDAVVSKTATTRTEAPTRQMKEAMFEMAVRQDVYEERQNQLRWQVKRGDDQISPTDRLAVIEARNAAWQEYTLKRGDPVHDDEFRRQKSETKFRRTTREVTDVAPKVARFDRYTNNVWAVRQARLRQFQQAARKVIIRLRASHKLTHLRQMMIDWEKNKYSKHVSAEREEKNKMEDMVLNLVDSLALTKEKVTSLTFPTYAPPNVKDDMPHDMCFTSFPDPELHLAVDALGKVPYKPTEVVVKKKVQYFPLKVPSQYQLLGYNRLDSHAATQQYVPPGLARPLRTGAEDELITFHAPKPPPEVVPASPRQDSHWSPVPVKRIENLQAPPGLFGAVEYPPLHIFNPAPGLQTLQQPLPYSETDHDFHLCPLPRYTSKDTGNHHMATQKQYIDRDETIRGVMTWKKFPSQGLTSLTNTPTLTSVWVPRWTDQFSSDLLPTAIPAQCENLSEEDKKNISDEVDSDAATLTPEMVHVQFPLINEQALEPAQSRDNTALEFERPPPMQKEEIFPFGPKIPPTNIPVGPLGPLPRSQREQELEHFLKKRHNKLGQRVDQKSQAMNNLKTHQNLMHWRILNNIRTIVPWYVISDEDPVKTEQPSIIRKHLKKVRNIQDYMLLNETMPEEPPLPPPRRNTSPKLPPRKGSNPKPQLARKSSEIVPTAKEKSDVPPVSPLPRKSITVKSVLEIVVVEDGEEGERPGTSGGTEEKRRTSSLTSPEGIPSVTGLPVLRVASKDIDRFLDTTNL